MAGKGSSAVSDEPIDVLFALHPDFNLLDMAGPLEVLTTALHDSKDPSSRAFEVTLAAGEPKVNSEQGVAVASQISWKDAHGRLGDFDVLVILGGNVDPVIKANAEPLGLIQAYSELQKSDPTHERTLMSICTGSLMLGHQGILAGLSATTHTGFLTRFENICKQAAERELAERTDVIEGARYVVNNLRFELEDEDDNPYIRRKSETGRRPSVGRKGSISFKDANRRESIARRAAMRLGGLRVITSGGVAAGIDAALYLVSILVSEESAAQVAKHLEVTWTKGVVVDGLDV